MSIQQDLVDFEVIETQKENIQTLAGGRSAKSLAQIFSPVASQTPHSHTQNLNDAIRAEYEKELTTIDDSDDPLDIYDRYVRWTLNAYPSAQATPTSQLLPLLERATKCFLQSDHYKNDPRYLKLWLHYIRLFSESPRETFAYLARHAIGAELALYYEEFAAWFETANRWIQAEEVYQMGIEKGARPTERLMRKFTQFQKRAEASQRSEDEPHSPALPTVRPALAAKIDPFSSVPTRPVDTQQQNRSSATTGTKKEKLQIFNDDGADAPAVSTASNGWVNIGNVGERKKENTVTARPWAGEKLNVGSRQNLGAPKMPIFRDQSTSQPSVASFYQPNPSRDQQVTNPNSRKVERISVNLERVYPNPGNPKEEYCFEELMAADRGWSKKTWDTETALAFQTIAATDCIAEPEQVDVTTVLMPMQQSDSLPLHVFPEQNLTSLNDENTPFSKAPERRDGAVRRLHREERANRTRKIKVREVKNETQTVQTNLSSPKGPKLRRKKSSEATMTMHSKAATDAIYEIFNQPLKSATPAEDETEDSVLSSEDDEEDEDDEYTSAGDSTGTGRFSGAASECGDSTQNEDMTVGEPEEEETNETTRLEVTETTQSSTDDTRESESDPSTHEVSDGIEPLIAHVAPVSEDILQAQVANDTEQEQEQDNKQPLADVKALDTRRPYRYTARGAQSRLPFMTPIVEKTESSFGATTARREGDYFTTKTPCPHNSKKTPVSDGNGDEVWSSPFQEQLDEMMQHNSKLAQPMLILPKQKSLPYVNNGMSTKRHLSSNRDPIIHDLQCNPMDDGIRNTILESLHSQLPSFEGFHKHKDVSLSRKTEIKKYCKHASANKGGRAGSDKTSSTVIVPPILHFRDTNRQYALKRELGAGAYAPVYLVESIHSSDEDSETFDVSHPKFGDVRIGNPRNTLEAIKMEDPPSPWEFYIIRTAHRRAGVSRASKSIVKAHEMHIYQDEGYLVLEFCDQGTLLDLVNAFVQQNNNGTAMDEQLAMFFTIEILRTVEVLHSKAVIHCDLKADNVLLRLSTVDERTSAQYQPDGTKEWGTKGVTLIDFGRGIDMRAFRRDVQFTADWETSATDCAEMREMRPWTYQADYYGIAAIAHTMLFGRYIETLAEKGPGVGAGKTYKLKESMKRYWQGEMWNEFFSLLLNPGRHVDIEEDQRMPCLRGMRAVREKMEAWLVDNCEKGVGLKSLLRKAEVLVANRKKA